MGLLIFTLILLGFAISGGHVFGAIVIILTLIPISLLNIKFGMTEEEKLEYTRNNSINN